MHVHRIVRDRRDVCFHPRQLTRMQVAKITVRVLNGIWQIADAPRVVHLAHTLRMRLMRHSRRGRRRRRRRRARHNRPRRNACRRCRQRATCGGHLASRARVGSRLGTLHERSMSVSNLRRAFQNLLTRLSSLAGFFRTITDGEDVAFSIARVYEKVEASLSKLLDEQEKYADWVALGSVSLDDFVNERLDEVGDWEANFKALRAASKDAEKLPTEVRVDNVCVSLTSMKAAIDEQMRSLQDSLTGSLKRKGEAEKLEVEQFLNDARDMLQMKANSVEEIAEMRAKAKEIVEKQKCMQMLRKKVEEKNKLIRTMGGSTVDINSLNSEWETVEAKLDQHEEHLDAQRSELLEIRHYLR